MPLIQDKISLKSTPISSPDIFNYNLSLFRDDINLLLFQLSSLKYKYDNYIAIYNDEYIEQLRHIIQNLENKIDSITLLNNNVNYTNIINIDFSSPVSSIKPFRDPKSFNNFTTDSHLFQNLAAGTLQSPEAITENIGISKVAFSSLDTSATYQYDNTYEHYYISSSPESNNITVDIYLIDTSDVTSIEFDSIAEFPLDITSIEYGTISGDTISFTELGNTSIQNASGRIIKNFPSISADILRLNIEMSNCKVTNRTFKSYEEILASLYNNRQFYLDLDDASDFDINFFYYIFSVGLQNIKVYNKTFISTGYYVSDRYTLKEPAHFSLTSIDNSNNVSLEYYLHLENYDINGIKLSNYEKIIPILPTGQTAISHEVLEVVSRDIFDIDETHNGKNVIKIAKPSFPIDLDIAHDLYEDGVISSLDLDIEENMIYFYEDTGSAIFTISYTPYHISRGFFTPIENPGEVVLQTHTFSYTPENEVNINITDEGGGVFTIEEVEIGDKYIKFLLPYSYEFDTMTIERYISNELDDTVPLLYLTGVDKNVFLVGRTIYIPFDADNYNKLYNSSYHITGEYKDLGLIDSHLYYYNHDNSIVINWDSFEALNTLNYGYTNLKLIIISRANNNSDSLVNIDNIYIYHNTFNDIILDTNDNIGTYDNKTLATINDKSPNVNIVKSKLLKEN